MKRHPLITRILTMLAKTEDTELSCDEVFALLDEFAELQAQGKDASMYRPLVEKHLRACPDCREEYEALLSMIAMNTPPETQLA
jgi:predicted anti-sigma-YlaC factor YlaD